MSSRRFQSFLSIGFLLVVIIPPSLCCFEAIFSFGDSLTDTGNYLYTDPADPVGMRPYGSTFFHRPTGRYSDGRIIADFIAIEFGLPLLRPYFPSAGSSNVFRQGANFAVGGATAVNTSFFRDKGIEITWTEYSLEVQVREFKHLLDLIASSGSDTTELLSKSLVLLGEIGGNDYFQLLSHNKTDEMKSMVPIVISTISSAVNTMIELGARVIVVPGTTALACTAYLLTMFFDKDVEYDPQTGCIKWLDEFVKYHNDQLQGELDRLRKLHPHVVIIYADYYTAASSFYQSPQTFGFEVSLAACCGGKGPYNVDMSVNCGEKNTSVCSDPSVYICWDGTHYTEAAYKIMAFGLMEGPYAVPPLKQICSLTLAY